MYTTTDGFVFHNIIINFQRLVVAFPFHQFMEYTSLN